MKQNQKTKRRGSILDLFLILLFLLCIVGAWIRWQELVWHGVGKSETTVEMIAQSDGVDTRILSCLSAGERLYTASGELFGTVRLVEGKPHSVILLEDGAFVQGEWDISRQCRLEIHAMLTGAWRDSVFLREGRYPIAVGQSVVLYTECAELHLKIVKIMSVSP